ncbi:MAG: hypothetical protein EZS28_043012, partial [Streblomastix strix]
CYCRGLDRSQGEEYGQPHLLSFDSEKHVAEEIKLLISINKSLGMEQVVDLIDYCRCLEVASAISIVITLVQPGSVEYLDFPVEQTSPHYVSAFLHRYQLNAVKATAVIHTRSLASV